MANTKKISKTRKKSFKNKNKKTRKSTILQKRQHFSRKYYIFKKTKLIKGGAKGNKFTINESEYTCTKPSQYVIQLNKKFLIEENKKYRKIIQQIAYEFLNQKNNLGSNTKKSTNIIIKDSFLVFMCYFFDDTEYKYIITDKTYYSENNNENKIYNLKPKRKEIKVSEQIYTEFDYPIHNTISKPYLSITGFTKWEAFLNHKLKTKDIETTYIREIIIDTLKEYINLKLNSFKIEHKQKLYSLTNKYQPILSLENLSIILGTKNTAIDFILNFCSYEEQISITDLLTKDNGFGIYAKVTKRHTLLSNKSTPTFSSKLGPSPNFPPPTRPHLTSKLSPSPNFPHHTRPPLTSKLSTPLNSKIGTPLNSKISTRTKFPSPTRHPPIPSSPPPTLPRSIRHSLHLPPPSKSQYTDYTQETTNF